MFRADILSCVPSNNYGYTDVKITYKGEPKDRCRNRVDDLQTTVRVDCIRKGTVETRLK